MAIYIHVVWIYDASCIHVLSEKGRKIQSLTHVYVYRVRLYSELVYVFSTVYINVHYRNLFWQIKLIEAIWRHMSKSTLAQVMACCPTAPSHYLPQCWLLISEVLWHSHESNSTASTQVSRLYNEFENDTFEMTASSPMGSSELMSCTSLLMVLLHGPGYHS